jgi:hypothetical protein
VANTAAGGTTVTARLVDHFIGRAGGIDITEDFASQSVVCLLDAAHAPQHPDLRRHQPDPPHGNGEAAVKEMNSGGWLFGLAQKAGQAPHFGQRGAVLLARPWVVTHMIGTGGCDVLAPVAP